MNNRMCSVMCIGTSLLSATAIVRSAIAILRANDANLRADRAYTKVVSEISESVDTLFEQIGAPSHEGQPKDIKEALAPILNMFVSLDIPGEEQQPQGSESP